MKKKNWTFTRLGVTIRDRKEVNLLLVRVVIMLAIYHQKENVEI